MGWDPSAVTIFGVKIPEKDLIKTTKKVKRYEHGYSDTVSFCPDTGKELWYEEYVYYLPIKYEGEPLAFGEPVMFDGLDFFYIEDEDNRQCFFGWVNSANQDDPVSEGEFNEDFIKGKLFEYFHMNGFDISSYDFKLYTVLR